ncbi:MAG: 3-phosphoshikimate 1-carboxyvinyltransferase [Lachnospiraceae bacterium]|jgi:3-phosphoshikimate 1-carboxyvinyltransferase|nr:3-phosphoshikimate 1-carboxyvinyltransferase [Lachnospiraceae bacterium]MCI1398728.1 3-phosphoshikimate 1-carboxyvinyltransferase [Lachnospiraceae bacterium]MCI1424810.1 3-phosphoshikimate 1-carboxyvinyltransferase [Lachnospiraceae bacterium]MCI1453505.1 3-phosphoshikimate 1-carboxyvinyltransferase [Lachnospiraceae bacterium]MDD5850060.1 3-phosphoshikimate 1-carboxyvinyltransferase [Bacillota bacterium]
MLTIKKAAPLRGEAAIPGDKSISHRSIMLGALADGDTHVTNFLESADCLSTIDCFTRLGIFVERDFTHPGHVIVHGMGMQGLHPSFHTVVLYTGNSGTTTRIMTGILAPQRFVSLVSGDNSVNARPMKRVITPLAQMGAKIVSMNDDGCAPLQITGTPLHGITYDSPVASAQVKSAILLAGLYAEGPTTVNEPTKSRDHTERMLRAFGASVETKGNSVTVTPTDRLTPIDIEVPGDISSAAYFLAGACIVPGSEVLLKHVGINPTRDGILRVAKAMGADIELVNETKDAEPCADLLVKSSALHGTTIGGDLIPTLIDELPVIAVMAACAEGTTVITDAAELRVKESDRIRAVAEGLSAMGADITPTADGFVIHGGKPLHGAKIHTYDDHRIAMSFAVAGLAAEGETILDDESCVRISYPSFFQDLAALER